MEWWQIQPKGVRNKTQSQQYYFDGVERDSSENFAFFIFKIKLQSFLKKQIKWLSRLVENVMMLFRFPINTRRC